MHQEIFLGLKVLSLSALLFRVAGSLEITVISNEKGIISLAEKQAKEKHILYLTSKEMGYFSSYSEE